MRTIPSMLPTAALSLALLQGCGDRDAEPAPDAEPTQSAVEAMAPEAAASESPANSIIRPDVAVDTVVDLPPEPLNSTIPFPDGGYKLDDSAVTRLKEALASEQAEEGWPIVLRGHTDSVGDDKANLRASKRRAEAVAKWLEDQGIDEDRISIIAMGEQRPIAPNAKIDGSPDEEGRAKNRRVEVWIGPAGSEPGDETHPEAGEERLLDKAAEPENDDGA